MRFDTLAGELRYALRSLRRAPAFTLAAILSLAVGIGVNTAVFSIADAIVFRPLAVPNPGRLVSIYHRHVPENGFVSSSSYPDYEHYRDNTRTLSGLLAYAKFPVSARTKDAAEQLWSEVVTPNYFDVLALRLPMGRGFVRDDEAVAVLSHGLWVRRFGANPSAVGGTLKLNGRVFTIIGVAPEGFHGIVLDWGKPPEVWFPLAMRGIIADIPLDKRDMHWLLVTGRLKDGLQVSQARAEMDTLSAQTNTEFRARVYPLQQARFWPGHRDSVLGYLELLAAIAALMLLIACTNVANLLLSRAARRRREIGIRIAIGAGRLRLARQMLLECLLLAGAGAGLGLLLATSSAGVLRYFHNPFGIPLNLDLTLNGRVLACAAALALLTAVLVSISPVRLASRIDISGMLKAGTDRRRGFRISDALVVAQFAICAIALAGAGLFLRTLQQAQASDPAFRTGNGLLASINLREAGYDEARGRAFYDELLNRVSALPGVLSAGYVQNVAMGGVRGATDIVVDSQTRNVNVNTVSPGYFQAAGLGMIAGRAFRPADRDGAPPVAVINEQMARALWPNEPPVGQRLRLRRGKADIEVVGVVRDGHMRNFREEIRACLYLPLQQNYPRAITLQVRTGPDALLMLPAVRREVQALDRKLEIRTMKTHLDAALSKERLAATLLAVLGVFATVLAAVGLYGVMATAVAQRSREIGIRMALGAEASGVLAMILRRSALLTAAGLAIGIAGSAALVRLIESLLYGVKTGRPGGAGCALLAAVGMAASWIPAARAARADPVQALREN